MAKDTRTVKHAGNRVDDEKSRLTLHGSNPERGYWESQGKTARMTDRPGRVQRRRP